MRRDALIAAQLVNAQLAAGRALGLPAPGTSDAKRLLPLLGTVQRPAVVDVRTPEIRDELQQQRQVLKLSRRQQRKQLQERRRLETAQKRLGAAGAPLQDDAGAATAPRRLDLALIHEPVRRAKVTRVVEAAPELRPILRPTIPAGVR